MLNTIAVIRHVVLIALPGVLILCTDSLLIALPEVLVLYTDSLLKGVDYGG